MSSEAVGGRTSRPGELEWDPDAATTSVGALGRAFKEALEKPRYFRGMVQWSALCGNRHAPAAVAMGQLTWPQALAHLDQMYKLAEGTRFGGTSPAVVFVYDELLRKSVANRAEWNVTGVWIWLFCLRNGASKSWKLLEDALLPTSAGRNPSGSNPPPVSADDKAKEGSRSGTHCLAC